MLNRSSDQLELALGISLCAVIVLAVWLAATKQRRNLGEARSALTVAIREGDRERAGSLLTARLATRRGRAQALQLDRRLWQEAWGDVRARDSKSLG